MLGTSTYEVMCLLGTSTYEVMCLLGTSTYEVMCLLGTSTYEVFFTTKELTSSVNCGILCLFCSLTITEQVPPLPSKVILSVVEIDRALVCCNAGVVGVSASLKVIGAGLLFTIGTTGGFFILPPTTRDPTFTIDSATST